jgi:hypothetical protein
MFLNSTLDLRYLQRCLRRALSSGIWRRRFEETHCFHLQDRVLLARLTFRGGKWWQHVPLVRPWTSAGLHGVTSQKILAFLPNLFPSSWKKHDYILQKSTDYRPYSVIHQPTKLTSWSWALLEKLPVVQLLSNFPAIYGTRRFITVFTRTLHRSLSCAKSIQSIPSNPLALSKIHFNIIHPTYV